MSEENAMNKPKKILDSSPTSGIAVPIAIVLVGALIIFGVTKMLSSGKDHKDLVEELNSKTFGNRWVAAYELSKYLATSKIPEKDKPWVVENLAQVYKDSVDARTRNFVVLALGVLNHVDGHKFLNLALRDVDSQVKFNAIVSIGNLPKNSEIDWEEIKKIFMTSEDVGLKQTIMLAMATHHRAEVVDFAMPLLNSENKLLKYTATQSLIGFNKIEVLPNVEEILNLPEVMTEKDPMNGLQAEGLKINILTEIGKAQFVAARNILEKISDNSPNIKVSTKAQEILKVLKN
jgi:hypothetical protein